MASGGIFDFDGNGELSPATPVAATIFTDAPSTEPSLTPAAFTSYIDVESDPQLLSLTLFDTRRSSADSASSLQARRRSRSPVRFRRPGPVTRPSSQARAQHPLPHPRRWQALSRLLTLGSQNTTVYTLAVFRTWFFWVSRRRDAHWHPQKQDTLFNVIKFKVAWTIAAVASQQQAIAVLVPNTGTTSATQTDFPLALSSLTAHAPIPATFIPLLDAFTAWNLYAQTQRAARLREAGPTSIPLYWLRRLHSASFHLAGGSRFPVSVEFLPLLDTFSSWRFYLSITKHSSRVHERCEALIFHPRTSLSQIMRCWQNFTTEQRLF